VTYLFNPPTIPGLGSGGGVVFKIQDRTGRQYDRLVEAAKAFMTQGNARPELRHMGTNMQPAVPQIEVEFDRQRAKTLGIDLKEVYGTMATMLSGSSVNDFNMFNRVYKVYIQAEGEFRRSDGAIRQFHVRGRDGDMVPISTFAEAKMVSGPGAKRRYNMFDSITLMGLPGEGYTTGDAMATVDELAKTILPPGTTYEWSGISYEEIKSAGQTAPVLAVGGIIAVLLLAALFESWLAPIVIVLLLPILALGSLGMTLFFGLANNVYFQIGAIAAIGLGWKHAIPFVLAGLRRCRDGMPRRDAAREAAVECIRPFLMSSVAFLVAISTLAFAVGPGAASRSALGISVMGGMVGSFLLTPLVLPPLFAVFVFAPKTSRPDAPAENPMAAGGGE
jgi:multidrug efflux pump subunit AcrB